MIMVQVTNFNELQAALHTGETAIEVVRSFLASYPIILPDKVTLAGVPQENGVLPSVMFSDSDGIGVTANNQITDLNIQTADQQRAIFNAGQVENLGTLTFKNLIVKGQFSVIMRAPSKLAEINLEQIHVVSADTRHFLEQPQKYGVSVLQGALTIYNFNSDPTSLIKVNAHEIAIGEKEQPVVGSGVFIAGFGDQGGRTEIAMLQTQAVYSTGKIPFGVADFITGGIFIVNGVHAKQVIHDGEIVTYGVNDMVLDAWGEVDDWQVNAPVISYGPSGVGFVNFGSVKQFTMAAPLQTYGLGARGYNQYDGTLENGIFQTIETFGDGSVGIQISKHVGHIEVKKSVRTHGGIGNSLVKGVNMDLPAYAVSVKDGGVVDDLSIHGDIETFGADVTSYIVDNGGQVVQLKVDGVVRAKGERAHAFKVNEGGQTPTDFQVEV
jgi:hypothetical protein